MPGQQENAELRALMKNYGYSREGLARAVNDEAARLWEEPGNCTARLVGYWLSGKVTWPRTRSRRALEALFDRTAEEIGFHPPPSGARGVTVQRSVPTPHQRPPVLRRTFALGLTGSLFALPPLPEAGRLGMADVERIKTSAAALHQIDDRHGGAQVAEAAGLYIEYVEDAARRCTYGGTVQTHLYTALGEICTSAGWFAFDAQQHTQARRHWDTGLRYALLARNNLLQARIWSSMSHQAWQLGHGSEAVAIARAALDQTRGRRDGRLSALLHTRVAQGHAIRSETNWSARSLLRAEKEFDKAHRDDQWLGFFNASELASTAALCFLDLHQYPQAVKSAREALRLVQPNPFRRNHLAAHVRLGRALAGAGQWEEAVAAGGRALELLPGVNSVRITNRLERFRTDLLTHGAPGAAEFSERFEAMPT